MRLWKYQRSLDVKTRNNTINNNQFKFKKCINSKLKFLCSVVRNLIQIVSSHGTLVPLI